MKARQVGWLILVMTLVASRADALTQEPRPERSDTARTVEALVGRWSLTGTIAEPPSAPAPFTVTMACRRAVLGKAVDCSFSGRLPGLGPMEASALIGYNPDDHHLYWMEISSAGEYHAHRGVWSGATMEFEPLTFTAGGATSVEQLTLTITAPGVLLLKSSTTTGAAVSSMEAKGGRAVAASP